MDTGCNRRNKLCRLAGECSNDKNWWMRVLWKIPRKDVRHDEIYYNSIRLHFGPKIFSASSLSCHHQAYVYFNFKWNILFWQGRILFLAVAFSHNQHPFKGNFKFKMVADATVINLVMFHIFSCNFIKNFHPLIFIIRAFVCPSVKLVPSHAARVY